MISAQDTHEVAVTIHLRVPKTTPQRHLDRLSMALVAVAADMDGVIEAGVGTPTPVEEPRDTSINVYFTGDENGPDLFGVVYDDEDGVLESAHENEMHGWRVPVQPLLERAVRLDGDHDD